MEWKDKREDRTTTVTFHHRLFSPLKKIIIYLSLAKHFIFPSDILTCHGKKSRGKTNNMIAGFFRYVAP